ncbi:acetolactate decarboxylase [Erwinia psidii]|nr:acetolactate decarboxylase [Erwinia psidii]
MSKIFQFSTLGALMAGHVQGECHLRELLDSHAFGLGCSEAINGELTIFQGDVWEATAGKQPHPLDKHCVPFVQITTFHPEKTFGVRHITQDNAALLLREKISVQNLFLAVCIEAQFNEMVIRRPQPTADTERDIIQMADTQQEDRLLNITGRLVGFWTPELYGRISAAGFHFHFIDEKQKVSGHVLSFRAEEARISCEEKQTIEITHPDSQEYKNLTIDLSALDAIISGVEK